MNKKCVFFCLFIVQCSAITNTSNSETNIKNNELYQPNNELPASETARQFNDQSVKLLNLNINNYLASLSRLNGQGVPSNEQLLAAAASLINTNKILSSNPGLANYQTLSSIINSSNYSNVNNLNGLNKPINLPNTSPINNPISNLIGIPNVATSKPNLPSNPIKPNLLATNPSSNLNIPPILSNSQPIPLSSQSIPLNSQPIQLNSQSIHAQNRNMINVLNNANKVFDLNNEDTTNSSLNNDLNPNYLTFNGENNMPEHYKLLITGMQKFSFNLIKSLRNFEPDNSNGIILSPFSIWSALLVTYMGAKTETEREMSEVLHLKDIPKQTVLIAYRGIKELNDLRCRNMNLTKPLNGELSASNQKMNFCSLANRVFFNSNLKLNKFVRENFEQETKSMDFVHEIERSRQSINEWISRMTNNKIKDLIAPGSINSFTNIVIANAIYFQAKWFSSFDATKTIKGKFQVNPTEEISVNYMRQTANFMFGVSESIKSTIIELPYSNQEFSMIFILPEPQMGIDSLIKQIKVEHLEEILTNLYDDEVEVQIPKFKFEQEFELAGPLYSMGMRSIFDPRFSDFSGFIEETSTNSSNNEINDVNNTNDDFFNNKTNKKVIINSVVHKAFISIDEEGTEAAAATSLLIARSGRPAFPSQFIANRPFLFLIRDTTTNAISFMGIVRRPQSD